MRGVTLMIRAVLQGFGPLHQQLSNTQGRLRSILGLFKVAFQDEGVRYRAVALAFYEDR